MLCPQFSVIGKISWPSPESSEFRDRNTFVDQVPEKGLHGDCGYWRHDWMEDQHLYRIMGNKTTTDTICDGRLSTVTMIDNLQQESTIPHDKWYIILANRHWSIALLDDTFKDMILELHQTGIPPQHYYKILQQTTASNMIHSHNPVFQRVIGTALRVSGVDVGMSEIPIDSGIGLTRNDIKLFWGYWLIW
jgi:hypothetical protein